MILLAIIHVMHARPLLFHLAHPAAALSSSHQALHNGSGGGAESAPGAGNPSLLRRLCGGAPIWHNYGGERATEAGETPRDARAVVGGVARGRGGSVGAPRRPNFLPPSEGGVLSEGGIAALFCSRGEEIEDL